jgi:hypothetical protein
MDKTLKNIATPADESVNNSELKRRVLYFSSDTQSACHVISPKLLSDMNNWAVWYCLKNSAALEPSTITPLYYC